MARRKRQSRQNSSNAGILFAITLVITVIVALGGGLGYLFWKAGSPTQLGDDYCPIDGESAELIVLLDTTDPFSRVTRIDIENRLRNLKLNTTIGSRFELRALNSGGNPTKILFSGCNPGDGKSVDPTIANPRFAQMKWEKGFSKPLELLFSDLPQNKANISPIMAGIQDIALNSFARKRDREIPSRIIIISDMIEHTAAYSQYRGDLSFNRYRSTSAFQRYATDLNKAYISIWYVVREKAKINSMPHINFWKNWIEDNKGQFEIAKKLQGLN